MISRAHEQLAFVLDEGPAHSVELDRGHQRDTRQFTQDTLDVLKSSLVRLGDEVNRKRVLDTNAAARVVVFCVGVVLLHTKQLGNVTAGGG